ncbi:hypothetical protein PQR39_35620 [Paraburkholderia sediminicola]|uniref:hypothetical protein n=1 Tax=Paraburkholderia sediminicola TaxID=458836 RepID=UPI0038BDE6C2
MMELDAVTAETNARASRVAERCSFRVVGYLMQHTALPQRAVVLDEAVRWFPNDSDFTAMMGWKKHSAGPGIPAEGWPADEMPQVAAPMVAAAKAAPSRPILTAPPTARLVESAEEALGSLAKALGCHWNDMIPHNTGWFVPGKPTAYSSAYDAIMELVRRLRGKPDALAVVDAMANAMMHEHPTTPARVPKPAKPVDTRQEALF